MVKQPELLSLDYSPLLWDGAVAVSENSQGDQNGSRASSEGTVLAGGRGPRLEDVVSFRPDCAGSEDGDLVTGDVAVQTERVMENLRACNKTLTRCEPLLFLASFE